MAEPIIEPLIEDLELQPNHSIEQLFHDDVSGNLLEKRVVEKNEIGEIIRRIVSKHVEAVRTIDDGGGATLNLPPPGKQLILVLQGGA